MATLTEATAAISRRLGIAKGRAEHVARRLQDADLLPLGSPGQAAVINARHVTSLILALLADAPLKRAADAVRVYSGLVPAGYEAVELGGRPCHLKSVRDRWLATSAGDLVRRVLILAATGDKGDRADLARNRLEVVSTWPELALTVGDAIHRYRAPGALASHWGAAVRRSVVVTGGPLVDLARDLDLSN